MKAAVLLTYIPGHCGIPFLERADQLAGEAVPFGELRREPADVMAELRYQRKARVTEDKELSWSHARLAERGWKYGDGARQRVRGRSHYLFNQDQLGVLTRSSLRELLRRGGPEQQGVSLLL